MLTTSSVSSAPSICPTTEVLQKAFKHLFALQKHIIAKVINYGIKAVSLVEYQTYQLPQQLTTKLALGTPAIPLLVSIKTKHDHLGHQI
jgi:hypothetical protein